MVHDKDLRLSVISLYSFFFKALNQSKVKQSFYEVLEVIRNLSY